MSMIPARRRLIGFATAPLLLIVLLQIPSLAATPTPVASASGAPPDAVNAQLRDAVVGAEKSLGTLSIQQKRIFDEEVVPDYPLFIRDYTRDGQGSADVQAQVDLDGIRSITRFIAPVGSKILLYLNVDPHCAKCVAESPPIRKMMVDRVERRGFVPVWVAPDELAAASITDLVGPRGTMGFLQVDLVPAPLDEDIEHEVRYFAKAQLDVRGVTSYQDQAELFDTDSFQAEGEKLLTHAFTDLGSRADLAGVSILAKDDMLIEVGKIADFGQYQKIRDAIRSTVKGVALVEQRRLSKGQAVFALKTRKSVDEIKALLTGLSPDGKRQLAVVGPAPDVPADMKNEAILMELR